MNPGCPAAGAAGCCCPPWCWWAWLLALALLACIPETIVVRARESSCQSLCVLQRMNNLRNGLGRDQTTYLCILESAPFLACSQNTPTRLADALAYPNTTSRLDPIQHPIYTYLGTARHQLSLMWFSSGVSSLFCDVSNLLCMSSLRCNKVENCLVSYHFAT